MPYSNDSKGKLLPQEDGGDEEAKHDEASFHSKEGASPDGVVGGTFSLTGVSLEEGRKILNENEEEGFDLDDRFIAEIMMSLNNEKIATLRKAFEQNDDDGLR